MVLAEGIAISGEHVKPLKDKKFVVIKKPEYVELPDMNDPKKTVRKLLVVVELSGTNERMDYYPNKTSIKAMVKQSGFEMDKWVGKVFEWITNDEQAFGKAVTVLYVK